MASPTLLLRGEQSALLSREGALSLAGEIRDARLVEIAGACHNVHLEQPERFLEAVLAFLNEVGAFAVHSTR